MKIIRKKPEKYTFTIKMTSDEAKSLINQIGEYEQGEPYVNHSAVSKLFMVLSDALQDLGLIEMTPNRKKGAKSYPRLDNDKIKIEEK